MVAKQRKSEGHRSLTIIQTVMVAYLSDENNVMHIPLDDKNWCYQQTVNFILQVHLFHDFYQKHQHQEGLQHPGFSVFMHVGL